MRLNVRRAEEESRTRGGQPLLRADARMTAAGTAIQTPGAGGVLETTAAWTGAAARAKAAAAVRGRAWLFAVAPCSCFARNPLDPEPSSPNANLEPLDNQGVCVCERCEVANACLLLLRPKPSPKARISDLSPAMPER
jgi:hypothetical protein